MKTQKKRTPAKDSQGRDVSLTELEINVLTGVAKGQTNKQIAAELKLGYETIKTYISRIRKKLDVATKTGLGVYAVRHNLVKL